MDITRKVSKRNSWVHHPNISQNVCLLLDRKYGPKLGLHQIYSMTLCLHYRILATKLSHADQETVTLPCAVYQTPTVYQYMKITVRCWDISTKTDLFMIAAHCPKPSSDNFAEIAVR